MSPNESSLSGPPDETLYAVLTAWASHARRTTLIVLAAAAGGGTAAMIFMDSSYWPLAVLMGVPAIAGAWGLIYQAEIRHPSLAVRVTERIVAGLGGAVIILAGLVLFFWALGTSWNH